MSTRTMRMVDWADLFTVYSLTNGSLWSGVIRQAISVADGDKQMVINFMSGWYAVLVDTHRNRFICASTTWDIEAHRVVATMQVEIVTEWLVTFRENGNQRGCPRGIPHSRLLSRRPWLCVGAPKNLPVSTGWHCHPFFRWKVAAERLSLVCGSPLGELGPVM